MLNMKNYSILIIIINSHCNKSAEGNPPILAKSTEEDSPRPHPPYRQHVAFSYTSLDLLWSITLLPQKTRDMVLTLVSTVCVCVCMCVGICVCASGICMIYHILCPKTYSLTNQSVYCLKWITVCVWQREMWWPHLVLDVPLQLGIALRIAPNPDSV